MFSPSVTLRVIKQRLVSKAQDVIENGGSHALIN